MKNLLQLKFLLHKINNTTRKVFGADTVSEGNSVEKGFRRWQKKIGAKLIKNHVFISESYDYGYISVPKVACTSIKSYLWRLEVNNPALVINSPHKFKNNPFKPINIRSLKASGGGDLRLNDRVFFALVRHPTKRVVSSYKDKILRVGAPQRREIEKILNIKRGAAISFSDFLAAIKSQDPSTLNPHWRPQSMLLPVGLIDFKVFKLEEIEVFNSWFQNKFDPAFFNITKENSSRRANVVPTADDLQVIFEIYQDDFVNFGYEKQ